MEDQQDCIIQESIPNFIRDRLLCPVWYVLLLYSSYFYTESPFLSLYKYYFHYNFQASWTVRKADYCCSCCFIAMASSVIRWFCHVATASVVAVSVTWDSKGSAHKEGAPGLEGTQPLKNVALHAMILDVPSKCGLCPWEGTFCSLGVHRQEHCPGMIIICPSNECDQRCRRDEMSAHVDQCPTALTVCGCSKTVQRRHLPVHKANECPIQLTRCMMCHEDVQRYEPEYYWM